MPGFLNCVWSTGGLGGPGGKPTVDLQIPRGFRISEIWGKAPQTKCVKGGYFPGKKPLIGPFWKGKTTPEWWIGVWYPREKGEHLSGGQTGGGPFKKGDTAARQ